MTNKRMETRNKRTRIIKRLLALDCVHKIAIDEQITASYVGQIAAREAIERCNHNRPRANCIRITL